RLPKLEGPRTQHPVCEGINVDRIFFDAKVSAADNSFILLEEKGSEIYLQAGTAHGITPGCIFAIHADLILDPANPSVGTMTVDKALEMTDPRWNIAFSGEENDIILRLVEKDLAALIVDVDASGEATFTFPKLELAIRHQVETLRHTVPAMFQNVYRVISAVSRFIWHLERFPQSRPFQAAVKMEFYKLRESGEFEETGSPILEADGNDLNNRGFASLTVNSEDRYAFRITNATQRDLYAYLFYFSLTTLAISPKYLQVVGNGQVDASLPSQGTLTLGYGSGGVKPFQFSLGLGESVEVGVFKLFLSTSAIDLSSIQQVLPFRIKSRRLIRENEAKHQFGALEVGVWDAITMELKYTQQKEAPVSEEQPGIQIGLPTPGGDKGDASEAAPSFASLISHQQHALLKGVKVNYGLVIDPKSGPRFSEQPVSALLPDVLEVASVHNTVITEEVTSTSALDAAFTHMGFPPLSHVSNLPLLDDFLASNDEPQLHEWTTRRTIVTHSNFSASPKDLFPNDKLISDVQNALKHPKDWEKLGALKDVFETWQ
ncbi:hypothetical protein FRC11_014491, partial [Ceratobasidium sp. 423]